MASATVIEKLRRLVWLLSESDAYVYLDLWGALLRRVRHEYDIPARLPNVDFLTAAEDALAEATDGGWHELAGLARKGGSGDPRVFLERCAGLLDGTSSEMLGEWWKRLREIAARDCNESDRCSFQSVFRERPCFPCPRLMDEFEGSGATPETLIFRMNLPSSDHELTRLGSFLSEFVEPRVLEAMKAVYFTFYYPGGTFRHSSMGWVAVPIALRPDIGNGWNFIHWATQEEMEVFLSPSTIIRKLADPQEFKSLLASHWVISAALLDACFAERKKNLMKGAAVSADEEDQLIGNIQQHVDATRDSLYSDHSLRAGLHVLTGPRSAGDGVRVIRVPFDDERGVPLKVSKLEVMVPSPAGVTSEAWVADTIRQFAAFADRIFHNAWPCRTYLRFPVLSGLQLSKGTDVFVALSTEDPETAVCALCELAEPLAVCASLIDGQMAFKAAHLLEQDVARNTAGLLRHEVKSRFLDIKSVVGIGAAASDITHVKDANTKCMHLMDALREQLRAVQALGQPATDEDTSVGLERFTRILQNCARVLPDIAKSGFTARVTVAGFEGMEKLDCRLLLICLLLLWNAKKHSQTGINNEPPGVELTVEKSGGFPGSNVVVKTVSWFSKNSDRDLRNSLARARPERPRRSFDAMLAAARDLNGDETIPARCFASAADRVQQSSARGPRWRVTVTYTGHYVS